MKTTVNFSQFCDSFRSMDRNDNFTYEGKRVLFDYLESLEEGTGQEIELDVIALCCKYSEEHYEDIAKNYSISFENCEDDKDKLQAVEEYLQEHTIIVGTVGDSIVYVQF